MRIAGTLPCSFCNGEGIRYVIFTQGCKHHCPGCQNPETWDFDGGREVSINSLIKSIREHPYIDGITLSGGDPFYQQKECCKLLDMLPEYNVWCYTGFVWDEIKDTPLAKKCDVVVSGPFVEELRCYDKMYGSSNQELHRKEDTNEESRLQSDC